ncbi:MAG: basic amino acid ABC transporter substrate-binding protein [Bacillota bacterium]
MKTKRIFFVVLVLLTAAALLAGCGGGKEKTQAGQQQAQQQQQQQQQPQQQAKPRLVVASDTAYAPFESLDTATGKYVGFDMDLIKAISEVMGYDEPKIESMAFDGVLAAVQTSKVDCAISAITINDDRLKKMNFSKAYYKSGLSIVVKEDNNTIKSIKDLEGKRIAVQAATTGAEMAKSVKGAKLTQFDRITDALLEVKKGSADAVINDNPVSQYYLTQETGKGLKIVGDLLSSEYYGIAVPKGKDELLKKINDALVKLKESGKFNEIYKKWFGVDAPAELPKDYTSGK